MNRSLLIFAAAAFVSVIPAHATVFSVSFSGTVASTQGATGENVGDLISGSFSLDDSDGQFSSFTIGSQSAPAGSLANNGLGFFDALYQDQLSPVSSGGNVNSTFTLDLSSASQWPVGVDSIYTLLTDSSQLPSNLDTSGDAFTSTFGFLTSDAAGNNPVSLSADLTSLTVTAATPTPEPATIVLLGSSFSLLGLAAIVRRRRA